MACTDMYLYRLTLLLLVCACAVRSAPQLSGDPADAISSAAAPEDADNDESIRRARQDSATTELSTGTGASARAPRPTKPSPRVISKLSLFNRASVASNLLGRPEKGYRKFTSSCRCEKIWNCPRLQITVPRCPDEFFLCCDL